LSVDEDQAGKKNILEKLQHSWSNSFADPIPANQIQPLKILNYDSAGYFGRTYRTICFQLDQLDAVRR
jgi:hypothetical protein